MDLENEDNVFYKGGDDDHPITFSLTNLGYINRTGPLYLTVEVFPTDYENRGDQYARVKLNGGIIDEFCSPDQRCGKDFYTCVAWMEISRNISSAEGGSLEIEVSSSGVKTGPCDYLGYPLYARVYITELAPPPDRETLTIWIFFGVALFLFFLLLIVGYYQLKKAKNEKRHSNLPKKMSKELSNLDFDPESNQVVVKSSPRRSPRFLSPHKVVPMDEEVEDELPVVGSFLGEVQRDHDDVEAARVISRNKSWLANYELDE
jgi:hypothetical protein